jgi:hypothetical protein
LAYFSYIYQTVTAPPRARAGLALQPRGGKTPCSAMQKLKVR